MKSSSRITSLILASAIIFTVFSGCSSDTVVIDLGGYPAETAATTFEDQPPAQTDEDSTDETGEQDGAEPIAKFDDEETMAVSTTAAITTTAVTTAPPAAQAAPPAAVSGINNETFIAYTNICDKYKPSSGMTRYLFNFSKSLSSGFGVDGTVLPTEAEYGIRGTVSGREITFTVYDHTGSKSVKGVYMQPLDASRSNDAHSVGDMSVFRLDTASLTNGLYRASVEFSNSKTISLYFYINGNETWLCEQKEFSPSTEKLYEKRRSDLMKVLKNGNVTPENSLTLDKVWYPFKATNVNERCDTQLWIDLSKTFINDSWSDEHKLYAIQAWIRENIAYDDFVSNEINRSRAQYYNDLTGRQSTYDLRAGVCFDYANIIAIICRAHGIPAVTIGSKSMNHVWNAVYVNGRWIEYDACLSEQYHVGKDTSVRIKTGEPLYDGIYSPLLINNPDKTMPSDALANQYFQQNSLYLF